MGPDPVTTDTEGGIESVRIKRAELRENVRAFFPGIKDEVFVL